MMIRIVFVVLTLFCMEAAAQTKSEMERLYHTETIYRSGNFFQKGTEKLMFSDLRHEFEKSPVGFDLYWSARKNRNTATALRAASLGASILFLTMVERGSYRASLWTIGGQIGLGILGDHYSRTASRKTDKALWQRNKDVLFSNF